MSNVAVRRSSYDDIAECLEEVVPRFLDDVKGKRILIKPNMLAPFAPEKAVTTHPSVVKGLYDCLVARGAEVKVGDNPGVTGYGSNERVARRTGILDAVGKEAYTNLSAAGKRVKLNSRFVDSVVVSQEVLDSDIVISVPKFKTHSLTVFTGAVKNMFGIAIGGEKAKLHTRAPAPPDFGEMIADLYAVRPPELCVVDAVVGMDGNGPSAGKPKPMGCVLVSKDAAAADSVMIKAAGYEPHDVPHLLALEKLGLGVIDTSSIEIDGEMPDISGFKLPRTYTTRGFVGTLINRRGFSLLSKPKLKIDKEKCTACAVCEESCPVGAIRVEGDCAKVDNSECAACYLCHEICPESSVKITGLLGFITGRSARS